MSLPIRTSLLTYHRDSYAKGAYSVESRVGYGTSGEAVASAPGNEAMIDCASGIGRFGTSRVIEETLRRLAPDAISTYPELGHETLLKPAILSRFRSAGLMARQLFLGHGSFNLMERVIHKLLRADEMLGVGPQFNEIPSEFEEAGGVYEPVPLEEPEYRLPVAALEEALSSRPVSILYVDNPNNPLGQVFDPADIERLARSCEKKGTVLLVDEAWGDYVADSDSAIHLVGRLPNVIVVRSFSKALGLAGERVGYMFMSEPLARYYREIDIPFEPSIVGATLARAVLDDPDLIGEIRWEAVRDKERIRGTLEAAGLHVLPTHPCVGIMAVHAPSRNLVVELRDRGIRVLRGSSFARTQRRWDDSFCRLSVVARNLVEPLCQRLSTL